MTEVLEKGDVFFLYRPRVEHEEAEGIEDVQRLYMVLKPHGKDRYRSIVLGQKKLPEVRDGGEKYWGFVDKVATDARPIREELKEETYGTKTRGERTRPAARPAGEGVYAIARHEDHTHLAYALELPEEPGEVQEALNIAPEASFVVSVKNPEKPAPRGAGLAGRQQAEFPERLSEIFRGRRFADIDPPEFLDHEGAELVFVGAEEDVKAELGIDLHPQQETEEKAEILRHLRLSKSEHPREPLLEGEWR